MKFEFCDETLDVEVVNFREYKFSHKCLFVIRIEMHLAIELLRTYVDSTNYYKLFLVNKLCIILLIDNHEVSKIGI